MGDTGEGRREMGDGEWRQEKGDMIRKVRDGNHEEGATRGTHTTCLDFGWNKFKTDLHLSINHPTTEPNPDTFCSSVHVSDQF